MIIITKTDGYQCKFNNFTDLLMNHFYTFKDFKKELYKDNIHIHSYSCLIAEYKIKLHKKIELLNKIYNDSNGVFECPFDSEYNIEVYKDRFEL